jgi:hypothetical protein
MLNTVLEENDIQFNNQYYKQNDGLAMGIPTSAILAEVFIQHLEHIKIIIILKKEHMANYFQHVNDILIVYNTHTTITDDTLTDLNTIPIQFNIKKETHNNLNYLDLTITNYQNQLTFDTFCKPTTTDLIIHNNSCHPSEHK